MFDFLLSKEEKCSRLFLTNYKIAFEYIPKICKRVCQEDISINILTAVNSWKPELRTIMNGKFYGAKMPKAFSRIDKDIIPFLIVGYSYTSVGMSTEPVCSIVVVDINRQKYRIFCMERFMGETYFLCGIDEGLHANYGIDYQGLKINEFISKAIEMGKSELLNEWREENAERELKRMEAKTIHEEKIKREEQRQCKNELEVKVTTPRKDRGDAIFELCMKEQKNEELDTDSKIKEIRHVEDFELETGALYTGEAIITLGNLIEITGNGCAHNLDGSKYEGEWFSGHPKGLGTYTFPNGDFHKGFFDDLPNGPGYLCLDSTKAMKVGIFQDGKLDGWMIAIMPNGQFNCLFMNEGKIVQDHTLDMEWMADILQFEIFTSYKGNMMQFKKDEYIRFGAPKRIETYNGVQFDKGAIGFFFTKEKEMYIGKIDDIHNLNGYLVKCLPNHTILCGRWENNNFVKEEPFEEISAYIHLQLDIEKLKEKKN